jgi:hypothetical protein
MNKNLFLHQLISINYQFFKKILSPDYNFLFIIKSISSNQHKITIATSELFCFPYLSKYMKNTQIKIKNDCKKLKISYTHHHYKKLLINIVFSDNNYIK